MKNKCSHKVSGIHCKKFEKPCLGWTRLKCKLIGGSYMIPAGETDHNESDFMGKFFIAMILIALVGLFINAWHNGSLPGLMELIRGLLK